MRNFFLYCNVRLFINHLQKNFIVFEDELSNHWATSFYTATLDFSETTFRKSFIFQKCTVHPLRNLTLPSGLLRKRLQLTGNLSFFEYVLFINWASYTIPPWTFQIPSWGNLSFLFEDSLTIQLSNLNIFNLNFKETVVCTVFRKYVFFQMSIGNSLGNFYVLPSNV